MAPSTPLLIIPAGSGWQSRGLEEWKLENGQYYVRRTTWWWVVFFPDLVSNWSGTRANEQRFGYIFLETSCCCIIDINGCVAYSVLKKSIDICSVGHPAAMRSKHETAQTKMAEVHQLPHLSDFSVLPFVSVTNTYTYYCISHMIHLIIDCYTSYLARSTRPRWEACCYNTAARHMRSSLDGENDHAGFHHDGTSATSTCVVHGAEYDPYILRVYIPGSAPLFPLICVYAGGVLWLFM